MAATNYEKRFAAIDEGTVYTHVEKIRQFGQTFTYHQPVKVIEKAVPIAGIAQLVGIRVERTDTGEQFDTHVKHLTRPWAEFIDLEVSRDHILEIVQGRAHQLRRTEVPATWRATLATNDLSDDSFVQDDDDVYVLVEYTTTRTTSRKKGRKQEERVTSMTLIDEVGAVRELKKRTEFKHLVDSSNDYEHVKTVSASVVFATEVDIEALTDDVVARLRQGEATLSENVRRPSKGIADIAVEVVKAKLNN